MLKGIAIVSKKHFSYVSILHVGTDGKKLVKLFQLQCWLGSTRQRKIYESLREKYVKKLSHICSGQMVFMQNTDQEINQIQK